MKQCNVWDAGQWVYIFIALLVKLKPSDNFKKAYGQQSQSSNQYHERNELDKEERECCPIIEGEVSRDLLVHMWGTKPQFHQWSGGFGDIHFLTQQPFQRSTQGVSLPPGLWRGTYNQVFLGVELIFTSERKGMPPYKKLPSKTAAGTAQPPESLMGISSKSLSIFSSTLQLPGAVIR